MVSTTSPRSSPGTQWPSPGNLLETLLSQEGHMQPSPFQLHLLNVNLKSVRKIKHHWQCFWYFSNYICSGRKVFEACSAGRIEIRGEIWKLLLHILIHVNCFFGQVFFRNNSEPVQDPQHMFYTWCGVPETWPLINMIKTHHANSWSFLLHQLHCSFIRRKQREMEFSRTITQPLVAWFGLQWTTSRIAWVAKPNCGLDQSEAASHTIDTQAEPSSISISLSNERTV